METSHQDFKGMGDWKEEILKKWAAKEKKVGSIINDAIRDRLVREFKGEISYNEPMDRHTSIRIGGKADVFLKPSSHGDVLAALRIAQELEVPFHFLGMGSNTLVKDGGIRGFVIGTQGAFNKFSVVNEMDDAMDVQAEAGLGITAFVTKCSELALTGMEALVGIPGSMGGAIYMNAGARGTEVQDIVREITVLDATGEERTISREKLEFTYRHLKLPRSNIILSGVFRLQRGNKEQIDGKILEYKKKRVDTQPLNFPNLGSIFKNPQPQKKGEIVAPAAKIIEELGLKGIRIGGARISEKHANFIINERNATARDVQILINLVKDKVKDAMGIHLETEIKIIGEDLEEKN